MVKKPKLENTKDIGVKAIEAATGEKIQTPDEQIKELQDEVEYLNDAVLNLKKVVYELAKASENLIVDMGETKSGKGLIISFFDSEDHEDKRFASFILPNHNSK